MTIDLIFIGIFLTFTVIALVFWRKYHDQQYEWYFWVFLALALMDIWDYLYISFSPFESDWFVVIETILYIVINPVLVGVAIYVFFVKKDYVQYWDFKDTKSGKYVRVRMNKSFKDFKYRERYPDYLVVHIELLDKDENGLPKDKQEERSLRQAEKAILSAIKKTGKVYYVARITSQGFRYIHLHLSEGRRALEILPKLGEEKIGRNRNYYANLNEDKDWALVDEYFDPFRPREKKREPKDGITKLGKIILVGAPVALVAYLVVTSVAGLFKKDTWMATYYPDPSNLLVSESEFDLESLDACREWVNAKAIVNSDENYDYECGRNCRPFDESLGIYEPYVCKETVQ